MDIKDNEVVYVRFGYPVDLFDKIEAAAIKSGVTFEKKLVQLLEDGLSLEK